MRIGGVEVEVEWSGLGVREVNGKANEISIGCTKACMRLVRS